MILAGVMCIRCTVFHGNPPDGTASVWPADKGGLSSVPLQISAPGPVKVETAYMNAVDPQTGADLWGDSRRWGSFMVAKATRSLIEQLRTQLALEKQPDSQRFAGQPRDRKTSAPFGN
jgi:hypothetical protein